MFTSSDNQARVNVTKLIRGTIEEIGEHHPAFQQYLTASVKTGRYCSYIPAADTIIVCNF